MSLRLRSGLCQVGYAARCVPDDKLKEEQIEAAKNHPSAMHHATNTTAQAEKVEAERTVYRQRRSLTVATCLFYHRAVWQQLEHGLVSDRRVQLLANFECFSLDGVGLKLATKHSRQRLGEVFPTSNGGVAVGSSESNPGHAITL